MIPSLVVTADPAVRDIVKVGLEQTGAFQVDTAEDAWALEMARSKPYRVVIVDGVLSDGSDGLEVLRLVREASGHAELLHIVRSRSEVKQLTADKQALGLYGFVVLPVEPLEFFGMLARLLERLGSAPTRETVSVSGAKAAAVPQPAHV